MPSTSTPAPALTDSQRASARRLRWAREYLTTYITATPLTALLALLALAGLLTQLLLGRERATALTFQPGNFTATWEPLTGTIINYKPVSTIFFLIILVLVGPLVERALGTWRFALTALASYLVPAAALTIFFSAAEGLVPGWAQALTTHSVFGLPLMLTGSLLAASRTYSTIWRRRVRLLACTLLLGLFLFGGSLHDIGLVLAALTGWACGVFLIPASTREHSLVGTRHEARTLVALTIAAISLGIFFAAHAPNPVGPLAAARYDVGAGSLTDAALDSLCASNAASALCAHQVYLDQTRGFLAGALAFFPLILQLVLALGLVRGRRLAAYGTLVLQGVVLLFSVLRLVIYSGVLGQRLAPLGTIAELEDAGARLLVPVLVPAALIALVLATLRYFPLASSVRALRASARTVGLVALAGLVLVTVVAAIFPQGFAPQPAPLPFALDYLVKLLPSAAWYVLPPSYAGTFWLTTSLHWLLPALTWLTLIICTYRVLAAPAGDTAQNRDRYLELVRTHGAGTLGWIGTWDNRNYWISSSGQEGFAYIDHGGIALTVGDPAAAPERVNQAVQEFARFCTDRGLAPALYSVHPPTQQAAQTLGWSSWQVAEEAIIDLADLKFSGKKFQSIRTALNQAGKQGITTKWTTYNDLLLAEWAQIVEISEGWVSEKSLPEMGFTLGGLEELKDPDTRILLALDESGFIHGVTSWMPVHRQGRVIGLTLDFMRRRDAEGVFAASMEFLIASAAQDAKDEGLEILSLSGAPLAHSVAPAERGSLDRLLDYLGERMEPLYGFRSLLTFKAKFRPRFEPMYLVTPDSGDLPAIGIAVSHAYLPEMKAKDVLGIVQAIGSPEK